MANKKARVLIKRTLDGIEYQPNQVIEADADLIKALAKVGAVDQSAAAVKHCLNHEGADVITHAAPEDDTGESGDKASGQESEDGYESENEGATIKESASGKEE